MTAVVLPPLAWRESPNVSERRPGVVPYLIVAHHPVGRYGPSIEWLCNPVSQASAHVVTEGNGTGVDVATQLVPWHLKAWTEGEFNSCAYGIEVDDNAWDGTDPGAFDRAARLFAFICSKTGIPPVWSRNPLHDPGIVRHADLGRAGGGHTECPTTDLTVWRRFIRQVAAEADRGGFRRTYGRGRFVRLG